MSHLFRPVAVKPIPEGSSRVTISGKSCVKWTGRGGQQIVAQLTDDGRRCRVESPAWWGQWTDENGRRKRERLSPDKTVATLMLADRVRDVERRRGGLVPLSGAVTTDTLNAFAADYGYHLSDLGRSWRHVRDTRSRITALASECGWVRVADVTLRQWSRWVGQQRENGVSAETINHYLRSARGLFRWLVRSGRLGADPLAGAELQAVDADRRLTRRAITADEFKKLIKTTKASKTRRYGLDGPAREALYLVAANTGLRAGELARRIRGDFHESAKIPYVTIPASESKNRKAAAVPLPKSIVPAIKKWLKGFDADAPLWPGRWYMHAASILFRDLRDAGIEPETREGQFDFHALRGYFATQLARAGVSVTSAQHLMRHSTPTLTQKHYVRLSLEDLAKEADRVG